MTADSTAYSRESPRRSTKKCGRNMPEFSYRYADNAPGKYYVDDNCLDCDLCRETAPTVFKRNDEGAYAYVARQPETDEERVLCEESIECCPCEAIGNDGDVHDWNTPIESGRPDSHERRSCKHCGSSSSFWTRLRNLFRR